MSSFLHAFKRPELLKSHGSLAASPQCSVVAEERAFFSLSPSVRPALLLLLLGSSESLVSPRAPIRRVPLSSLSLSSTYSLDRASVLTRGFFDQECHTFHSVAVLELQ